MVTELRIEGAEQLRSLARDLRKAGSEGKILRKNMRRAIQAAAEPMKRDVQAAALAIPAKGPKSTGLRAALAKSTKVQIITSGKKAGVRLFSSGKAMERTGHPATLAGYMEGLGRWRHPVFGDTDKWVPQTSHPYFYDTANRHLPAVQAGVIAAVDETAKALERGHL